MAIEHKDIKVAKITVFQAIFVAVITTFGGALAGYLVSHSSGKPEKYNQEWLVIKSIEYAPPRMTGSGFVDLERFRNQVKKLYPKKYRLVIRVDNVTYSYPSIAVWQELGESGPEQRIPLERKNGPRNVSFEALYKTETDENIERAISTELQQVNSVPYSGTYRAIGIRVDDGTRAGARGAFVIKYEIRNDFPNS